MGLSWREDGTIVVAIEESEPSSRKDQSCGGRGDYHPTGPSADMGSTRKRRMERMTRGQFRRYLSTSGFVLDPYRRIRVRKELEVRSK
jgi:hypothetical protein